MKVTFITPPYNIIKSAYGSKSRINYGNLPPLGVLYIAGELRKYGHDVQLIDAAARSMSYEEIFDNIKQFRTDIIGISTMTPSAQSAYELIRTIKKKIDLPVVLGGVHANSYKEKIFNDITELDIVSIGEGEKTIVEIVEAYENGSSLERIKGISFRDAKGNIVLTEPRPYLTNLDDLAFPARDILDNNLYRLLPLSFKREPVTSMITSRGCPYGKCSFCFEAGSKSFKYRRHSPEYVIKEIEDTIVPNGIKEIAFWDDYFLINPKWLDRFFELMEKFDITWTCYGYPKTVNKEMLTKASKAGCWAVLYGFESGDQRLLDVVNKGITLEQSRNAAKWTHEAGMATRASFMLALPGETPELAKKTVDFAIELDCTMAQFLPTFPEEGTPLHEIATRVGKTIKYNSRTRATYVPDGYKNEKEVEKMIRWAYLRFYFRCSFIIKHIKRIKSWTDFIHYWNALKFIIGIIRK